MQVGEKLDRAAKGQGRATFRVDLDTALELALVTYQTLERQEAEQLIAAFRSWDSNHDGELQFEEWETMVSFSNPSLPPRMVTKIFRGAQNADGVIDLQRFSQIMMGHGLRLETKPTEMPQPPQQQPQPADAEARASGGGGGGDTAAAMPSFAMSLASRKLANLGKGKMRALASLGKMMNLLSVMHEEGGGDVDDPDLEAKVEAQLEREAEADASGASEFSSWLMSAQTQPL